MTAAPKADQPALKTTLRNSAKLEQEVLAALPRAWWVGETVRDLSYLKPWQLFVFKHVQLRALRFFFWLGLPCLEVPYDLKCPHCHEKVQIPNGGSWKEAVSICTSRAQAEDLCRGKPARWIDWLPINRIISEGSMRTGDFSVPALEVAEVVPVKRAELEAIHSDLLEATQTVRSLIEPRGVDSEISD